MLWACILLPQLAMDSALRQRSNPDAPLALLGGPAQRRQLQAVNPAARALGLKPGQSLIAAQALSRDFATAEYDLAAVERWQAFLAAWAYGFSSQVSLHYPRALLLEVQSSLALFGPWPRFEPACARNSRRWASAIACAWRRTRWRRGSWRTATTAWPSRTRQRCNASCPPFRWTAWDSRGSWPSPRTHGTAPSAPGPRVAARRPGPSLPGRTAIAHRPPLRPQPLALEHYRPPDTFDLRIELNFDVESHQALLFPCDG